MKTKILKQYEEENMNVTEYTKDGKTVSHTIKVPIPTEQGEVQAAPQLTLEDKVNYLFYKEQGLVM